MVKVVVVNGAPSSGKSLFERLCKEQCSYFRNRSGFDGTKTLYVDITSTVDFVKEIAYNCGWDGTKTPENRKFLSDLKALLTKWNNVPYEIIKERVENLPKISDWIIFVDCREPEEVQKLKDGMNATTLLIRRDQAENTQTSNASDANVLEYNYDLTIWNNSDIIDLEKQAENFIEYMKKEEVPYYVNVD